MAKSDLQNPAFTDENKAREALESIRWPTIPTKIRPLPRRRGSSTIRDAPQSARGSSSSLGSGGAAPRYSMRSTDRVTEERPVRFAMRGPGRARICTDHDRQSAAYVSLIS